MNHQIDRALLDFNHILLCAPNAFPSEEDTDLRKEFRRLLRRLADILSRVKYPTARQWLQLAVQEAEESLQAYLSGDEKQGSGLLQSAEEHFRSYVDRKKGDPAFLGRPGGEAEKA